MNKKIDEIVFILQNEKVSEFGLLSGLGGQILTCSELFLHKKVSQDWLTHLIHTLEKKLENEEFLFTHCSGLSGIGWLYEYLSQRAIIDYDTNLLLEEFDSCLEKELIRFLWQGNYDFLHGGVGIALYFIKRVKKKKELVSVLNRFLEDLENISTKQEDGSIKWLSILSGETQKQEYNISLSHGMASIIGILSKLYKIDGVDKEKTEKLLRGAVQYILAQEIDKKEYGSYFSSVALESTPTILKSRMGWCYGDLGIASTLYQTGIALGERKWIEKAIEVLLFAATERRDLQSNFVMDAGLCHGSAGIGHIFYRMWWNTKLPQFKDTADYWFSETLKIASFEDGLTGFKTYTVPDGKPTWTNDYGFLTGIFGIGIALLTYYYEIEPTWDECLLLS
jgi:lantibiotic modifying enzyme